MFNKIKDQVSIVQAHNHFYGDNFPLKESASGTMSTENDDCPWCGHKGCYKVNEDRGIATCFSGACHFEGSADVIEFARRALKLESLRDAAVQLIKDFNLDIEYGWDTKQRIWNTAMEYYQQCLMTLEEYRELDGMCPGEYQTKVRGHRQSTLDRMRVGWADGNLYEHLIREGYDSKDIASSGLMSSKNPKQDYFRKVFVYPHITPSGRCGNFTIKRGKNDKGKNYQVPIDKRPCEVLFMGEDSLDYDAIAVVEGENDGASLYDYGWEGGVLIVNGQLSKHQIDALIEISEDRVLYTFFDADKAGLAYIDKMWKAASLGAIKDLHQFLIPEEINDIDNFIQFNKEASIELLLSKYELERPSDEEIGAIVLNEAGSANIVEAKGGYWAIRKNQDHDAHIQLTNFTIALTNVYIREGQRIREVVIKHARTGQKSSPFLIDSSQKVSIRDFRELAANSVDGFFKGNEQDLINIWEYVYENSTPKVVQIPLGVGDVTREAGGWLFRNAFISRNGQTHLPDENGVFWPGGNVGVKPASITSSLQDSVVDINLGNLPSINIDNTEEEMDLLEQNVLLHMATCLNDPGMALSLLAWAKASVSSRVIHKEYGFFPLLLVWGRHGQGKTTLANWILDIFGTKDSDNITTVSQLKSNVGFERKSMFYHSIPMFIDELRADKMALDRYSYWRGCFNRSPRTMGTREGFNVRTIPMNSTFGFFGQDTFTDPALRSRCIALKMPTGVTSNGSFDWLNRSRGSLSAISYKWILQSTQVSPQELFNGMREEEEHIISIGCEPRMCKIWSIIAYFAKEMQQRHFPDFNFDEYLLGALKDDIEDQKDSELLTEFWETVSKLQTGDNAPIGVDFIKYDRESGELVVWLRAVYDAIKSSPAYRSSDQEKFTIQALRSALRDEPYYVTEERRRIGRKNAQQRCVVFDVSKFPENSYAVVELADAAY